MATSCNQEVPIGLSWPVQPVRVPAALPHHLRAQRLIRAGGDARICRLQSQHERCAFLPIKPILKRVIVFEVIYYNL